MSENPAKEPTAPLSTRPVGQAIVLRTLCGCERSWNHPTLIGAEFVVPLPGSGLHSRWFRITGESVNGVPVYGEYIPDPVEPAPATDDAFTPDRSEVELLKALREMFESSPQVEPFSGSFWKVEPTYFELSQYLGGMFERTVKLRFSQELLPEFSPKVTS